MNTAYVGIGSNIGDRFAHLEAAVKAMAGLGTLTAGSPIYETEPMGGPDQGRYLNAVVVFDTELAPHDLLRHLIDIERLAGRIRDERWGPRTLDLDILAYGNGVVDEPGLTIPHPEIRSRRFVLTPLTDVAPGLSDASGPYADALGAVSDQWIKRLTGPIDPTELRWRISIEEATTLTKDGSSYFVGTRQDWSNTTGDMFGAFLAAVALRSVEAGTDGHQPASLAYRYLHGIPQGAEIEVAVSSLRRGARSEDFSVSLSVDGNMMGVASVTTISQARAVTVAPPMPLVLPISACRTVYELSGPHTQTHGAYAQSWGPLQRWDIPDLIDGDGDVFRAWSPNIAVGSDNPFLQAAAIVMPVDALVWPASMDELGYLDSDRTILTPTLDLSARFPELSVDPGWHLSEVAVDYMTDRSVAATIRVWADNHTYLSTGTSHNLVLERQ